MSNTVITEVVKYLQTMPDNLQEKVLQFTQQLKDSSQTGVSGKSLLQFANSIPPEDLQLMQEAISAECEKIDINEW